LSGFWLQNTEERDANKDSRNVVVIFAYQWAGLSRKAIQEILGSALKESTMSYPQCHRCGFWITSQDRFCPNCGTEEPQDYDLAVEQERTFFDLVQCLWTWVIWAMAAFVGLFVAWALKGVIGGIIGLVVAGGVIAISHAIHLSQCLAFLTATTSRREKISHESFTDLDLGQYWHIIQQRLNDLKNREKQFAQARQRAEQEGTAGRLQTIKEALDRAAAILRRQRQRYCIKAWEIALALWQISLEPLTVNWNSLTYEECEHRLQALSAAQERGEIMLRKCQQGEWNLMEPVDRELSATPEGQALIASLRKTLAACQELRQGLMAKQAALALKSVAPLEEAIHPATLPYTPFDNLDRFNARAAIGEFTSGFRELEEEYARLKAEERIARL